jgi:hypothetical protein
LRSRPDNRESSGGERVRRDEDFATGDADSAKNRFERIRPTRHGDRMRQPAALFETGLKLSDQWSRREAPRTQGASTEKKDLVDLFV